MPELRGYSKDELPRDLAIQVASYVRVQWPFLLGHRPPLWESTPYPKDGKHFVLFDGDILIAHALAHTKTLNHIGQTWTVGALSSVFTYPTHRGIGYGEQVAKAATNHLRTPGIDFALLFCGKRVSSMYTRLGWEYVDCLDVTYGDSAAQKSFKHVFPDSLIMGMVLSDRAKQARPQLEGTPLYVGKNTW